jgi:uroporphyrinogen decarboxylase
MSTREKFFNAMRRRGEGYVPFEFGLCPSQYEEFKRRTGAEDVAEYYGFPCRHAGPQYVGGFERYHKYYNTLENIRLDDWGVGYRKGSLAHFTEMQHPMKDFETIEEFMEYPYPHPVKDYDWIGIKDRVKAIKDRDLVAVAGMQMTIFEYAWYLRGMDELMVDMLLNPELANYHLDRITEIRCEFARRYAEADIDMLSLGDDVSTQLAMMMSPDTWREFLKPRLEKVIRAAKEVKPDMLIFYHGDGNLQVIIPDLIEIGVEILNPVQAECMDPVEIKRQYGDKLSFCGTIGTQTTLPFGTPDEVRAECRRMIKEVGKGGGVYLAPTHIIEPEVPWENIQAFVDTVREYNENGFV